MSTRYSTPAARAMASKLGLLSDPDTIEQLRVGMGVEREHDDVTGGDDLKTAKIAAAHLREDPLYYVPLTAIERFRDGEKVMPRVHFGIHQTAGGVTIVMHLEGRDEPIWAVTYQSANEAHTIVNFLQDNPTLAVVYAWMHLTRPQ